MMITSRKTFALTTTALMLCACGAEIAGAAAAGNEYLDLDIAQLMNITVTSVAKRDQRLADAPAAVFVITQEDIRRSGVTNIADALAMTPGIQVAQISASKWSVSSRGFAGFTSNKLLVLIDGRSVYSPAYSGVFWDAQNTMLEDIDRIEVIRGPGGTLWGANAVNGVINIITKKAEDTQGTLVRASLGGKGAVSSAGRYGGKISDTTFARFYLTYDDFAANRLHSTEADGNDSWQPKQTGFRMDGQPTGSSEWTLQGDLYDNEGDQWVIPYWTSSSPYYSALNDQWDAKGGNILGRWHQELSGDQAITFKAYYDYNKRSDAVFNLQFTTLDLDLQYETKLGQRQNLTLGAEYRSIQGEFDETYQVSLPDRNDNLYSAFVQDEINLVADRLWLTLGTKYEHNDYTGNEWQPSAKLLWKIKDNHSLWTSAARSVRTPSIVEQYGRVLIGRYPLYMGSTFIGTGDINFVGNQNFDSEIVNTYELGYRWQASRNLSFDLALFYNDYDEIYTVFPTRSGFDVDSVFVNAKSGNGQGFELAVDWQARSWLTFALAYSYLETDLTTEAWVGTQAGSDWVAKSAPENQVSLRSSIALADDWQLNLWLRYVDQIFCRNTVGLLGDPVEIDAYFVLNTNLIWTPSKHLEFMLAGLNLTDSGQLRYLSEYQTPATEIERMVYGKFTWRF
ncbi:MAG: TonB-dependent receptor plug domain-containing protein [Desulfobulbus sp.]